MQFASADSKGVIGCIFASVDYKGVVGIYGWGRGRKEMGRQVSNGDLAQHEKGWQKSNFNAIEYGEG